MSRSRPVASFDSPSDMQDWFLENGASVSFYKCRRIWNEEADKRGRFIAKVRGHGSGTRGVFERRAVSDEG